MKHGRLDNKSGFHVITGNARSQAAAMIIPPGGKEGGPDNRHAKADQWLHVTSGKGEATVAGRTVPLAAGALLLVERKEPHEIRNTGTDNLVTLNFYVPPAYSDDGEEL